METREETGRWSAEESPNSRPGTLGQTGLKGETQQRAEALRPPSSGFYLALLLVVVVTTVLGRLEMHAWLPHWSWESSPVHSTMEAIGALAAVLMGVFLLLRQQEDDSGRILFPAVGFLGMGLLDGLHAEHYLGMDSSSSTAPAVSSVVSSSPLPGHPEPTGGDPPRSGFPGLQEEVHCSLGCGRWFLGKPYPQWSGTGSSPVWR